MEGLLNDVSRDDSRFFMKFHSSREMEKTSKALSAFQACVRKTPFSVLQKKIIFVLSTGMMMEQIVSSLLTTIHESREAISQVANIYSKSSHLGFYIVFHEFVMENANENDISRTGLGTRVHWFDSWLFLAETLSWAELQSSQSQSKCSVWCTWIVTDLWPASFKVEALDWSGAAGILGSPYESWTIFICFDDVCACFLDRRKTI